MWQLRPTGTIETDRSRRAGVRAADGGIAVTPAAAAAIDLGRAYSLGSESGNASEAHAGSGAAQFAEDCRACIVGTPARPVPQR